jgi:type IV pilus assembly protein PilC
MAIYIYKGKSFNGRNIKGKCEAEDIYKFIETTHNKGYYITSFKKMHVNKISFSKISFKDIAVFSKQLSIILSSGINLIEGLTLMSTQAISKSIKENTYQIIKEIKKGESLSKSFLKCKYPFPDFLCKMIRIGEESGRLEEVLSDISNYYDKESKLLVKINNAMLYPIMVLIAALLCMMFLMTVIVPSLTSTLISLGGDLPTVTKIILFISKIIRKNFIANFTVVILAIFLCFRYTKKKDNIVKLSNTFLKTPFIGKVYKKKLECRVLKAFYILINSGVNVITALEYIKDLCQNNACGDIVKIVIEDMKEGLSISEAFEKSKFFNPVIVSMLRVGEETGKLDEILNSVIITIDEEIDIDIEKLTQLIQPLMLLILAFIVGIIISSIILPMFNIMDKI